MTVVFESNASSMQKYGPAMSSEDQDKADEYFAALIEHAVSRGASFTQAEARVKASLRMYMQTYDHQTQERVTRLFNL